MVPASSIIDSGPQHAAMRHYMAVPRLDLVKKQRKWLDDERAAQQKRVVAHSDDAAASHPP